jgi:hypothetical protein
MEKGLSIEAHQPVVLLAVEGRNELTSRPSVGSVHMATIKNTVSLPNQPALALLSTLDLRRLGLFAG